MGSLKLSKTAIRELTRLYRGVLMAAMISAVFVVSGAKADPTPVSDWAGLQTALTDETSDINITGNITASEGDGFYVNGSKDINLNGYTINGGDIQKQISIRDGADQTVSFTGGGKISHLNYTVGDYQDSQASPVFVAVKANLELNDGDYTFENNASRFGIINLNNNYTDGTTSLTTNNVGNLTFKDNNSTDQGGVLYITGSGSKPTKAQLEASNKILFDNNSVTDASKTGHGGAVMNMGTQTTISANTVEFTNNKVLADPDEILTDLYKSGGGAIQNAYDGVLTVGKAGGTVKFDNNSSTTNGGALLNRGNASTTLNGDVTFSNNTADVNGGAVYNISTVEQTINNAVFSANEAVNRGGAVYNYGTLNINGATFTGNSSTGSTWESQGGAIYNAADDEYLDFPAATLVVSNTTFGDKDDATKGNSALYGGAIANVSGPGGIQGSVTLNNTNFYNNKAYDDPNNSSSLGGAIYNEGEMAINGNTEFKGNTAEGYNVEGGAIYNNGTITFNDEVTFDSNTATDKHSGNGAFGGAISNTYNADLTFKDFATFTGNKALSTASKGTQGGAIYAADDSSVTFEKGVLFSGNEAVYGGAVFVDDGATLDLTDATFTDNKAGDEGGAIFTYGGTVNVNAVNNDVAFSGNTANGQANDITNYGGTINLNAASGKTISLAGGIDGESGEVNVTGAGLVETTTIKNQTVTVSNGELALKTTATDGSNLDGSTVSVASGATINTIDDVINDYMTGGLINLADGAKVAGDVDFENGLADKYAATSGTIKYTVANLIGAAGNGNKTIQVAGEGSTIDISEAVFNSTTGMTFTAGDAGSGTMVVNGIAGGIENAADQSANVSSITYDLTADESIDTAKEIKDNFVLNGDGTGAGDAGVTLNADLGVADGADLTLQTVKLEGTADLNNAERGTLRINNSRVGVNLNNYGTLISDPTYYDAKVVNEGTATFDGDVFESTASLTNNATVNLNDVEFVAGSTLTGGAGNVLNISGTGNIFNGTSTGNNAYIASGADWTGTLSNGYVNLQNGGIDAITGSVSGGTVALDADLNAATNKLDSVGGLSSATIKSINLLNTGYGTAEKVEVALGGATLAGDYTIEGMNYYTKVEEDTSGNLVFSDKLVNTSTIRGTGDGSTTWTGDVIIGDRADTTTIGTTGVQIALDNTATQIDITAGDATDGSIIGLDEGSVNLEAANSTSKGTAKVSADASNNKAVMEAEYNGADKASVVAKADSGSATVTVAAKDGLIVSDAGATPKTATLTAKSTGLDVAEGLTVNTNKFTVAGDTGNTTVGGTLKVGAANAITGSENSLAMGSNSLTGILDIASTALTTSASGKTVAIGGADYTTTVTGNEVVTGTLQIGGTSGPTLTGSSTGLTVDKQIVDSAGFKVDANNLLTSSGLTASAATISGNASVGSLTLGGTAITATAAEINYLSGVTSNVQDQLDARVKTEDLDNQSLDIDANSLKVKGNDVLTTADKAPAYTGSTLADVNAYVSTNSTKIADIGTTAALVTDLLEDKEAWIGQELGYDTTTTDANTVLSGYGFTDQNTDGKVGFADAAKQNRDDIVDIRTALGIADGDTSTTITGAKNITDNATFKGALTELDTAIGDMSGFAANNHYATGTVVATNLTSLDAEVYKLTTDTTTGALNVATANVGGNATVGGTLKIGAANAITGSENTLAMGSNSLTGILDIASTALTTSASGKTVAIGGADYTTTVTGAEVVTGTLTADGESKFGKYADGKYALDVTTSAVVADKVVQAKSGVQFGDGTNLDATPMTSVGRTAIAAKAAAGSDAVVASATAVQLTRADIEAKVGSVLGGVYKIDGTEKTVSYDSTALAGNGFKNTGDNLTVQLKDYASNVATATGLSFNATTGANTTDYADRVAANYNEIATGTSLRAAVEKLDSNIGADSWTDASSVDHDLNTIVVREASVAKNGVAKANTVNQNIVALNETIGDLTTLPADTGGSVGNAMATRTDDGSGTITISKPATVVEALTNIDATLGKIHGLKDSSNLADKSNLAAGTTVEQHLVSLDDSVGDRTQFSSARYISSGASVADAAMALDNNLSRVERDLDQTKREMKGGFAAAAAMAALVPNARAAGDTQVSVGTGTYRGRAGMALGGFHYLNDNVLLNVGASYAGSNSTTFKAGVTFGW